MALAGSWLGGPGRRGWGLTGSPGRRGRGWEAQAGSGGGVSEARGGLGASEVCDPRRGGPGPSRPPLGSTLEKTSQLLSKFALQGLG